MSRVIGIDLGTTNSCVSVVENGQSTVIPNSGGYKTTPSMFGISQDGKRLVGHLAKRQAITNARNTIFASKRLIGRRFDDPEVQKSIDLCPYEIVRGPNEDPRIQVGGKTFFTGAVRDRIGRFELADGGTLFLDEIGDLSLSGQAKLLRVLEEKVVVRVGGSLPIKTDTRVIAATNQDLTAMVQERRFREDLFFRLNVVTINMPPLRDRPDDIELLANHFLKDFSVKARRKAPVLSADAIKRLRQHSWPGNVRELRNLMERIAYLSQDDRVDADDLAFIMSSKADSAANISTELTLGDATKKFQVDYIHKQIELAAGNMSEAAKRMGLHRSNLYRKMRQLEMSEPDEQVAD